MGLAIDEESGTGVTVSTAQRPAKVVTFPAKACILERNMSEVVALHALEARDRMTKRLYTVAQTQLDDRE